MLTRLVFRVILVGAVTTFFHVPVVAQSEEDAVRDVLVTYAERMQAGDLEGMGALVAPERGVHIIEGAGVNHGWADYRDHHLGPELERAENFEMRYFAVEPQVRGDVAWTSFRYELAADMSGNQMEIEGRGTAVLERREGQWLIVHLHTSGRRKRAEG
jgi:ketosteroid isomerase-like protein